MRVELDPDAAGTAPAYSGRVIKILDKIKARAFAVYRAAADGSGRALPVEKRGAAREYLVPAGKAGEARDGDLVAIEPLRETRFGPPAARVVETIGSVKSERAVSLIALSDASHPACLLARGAERGGKRTARSAEPPARGLAQPSARHHRSARRQGPRRRGPCRFRFRPEESGRVRRHRRDRRRCGLCPPRLGLGSRGARARELGLFPRPGRADAAGAHLERPLLAASRSRIGRRSRCAWRSAPTGASASIRSTAS